MLGRRKPYGAKPYLDREGADQLPKAFVTESTQEVTPSSKTFELGDVLQTHMDGNGVRFVERKLVEAAEQYVATSAGCS